MTYLDAACAILKAAGRCALTRSPRGVGEEVDPTVRPDPVRH